MSRGVWIVDDELDSSLPLPKGPRDIPVLLADRTFDKRNQLTDPFAAERRPPFDGVVAVRDDLGLAMQAGLHPPLPFSDAGPSESR